jgi:hypothetical protein
MSAFPGINAPAGGSFAVRVAMPIHPKGHTPVRSPDARARAVLQRVFG